MLSFSLALRCCAGGVVEGKRIAVCRAGVGAQSFERAHHTMVDQIWLLFWSEARDRRSATKERGMRVPGFGKSHAHIRNEEAAELLRSLHGSAFLFVSSYLSHAVHSDRLRHCEHPPSSGIADNGDSSALVMPDARSLCQVHRGCWANPCGTLAPPLEEPFVFLFRQDRRSRKRRRMPLRESGCSSHGRWPTWGSST